MDMQGSTGKTIEKIIVGLCSGLFLLISYLVVDYAK
jgi:hypothetical protein